MDTQAERAALVELLAEERANACDEYPRNVAIDALVSAIARLDEQAAASVPSCETAQRAVAMRARIDASGRGTIDNPLSGDEGDLLWALDALLNAIRTSAQSGHLDGGARALDASEALREARVQGMREALTLAYENEESDYDGCISYVKTDKMERLIDAAIEAVRKGER